MGLDRGRQARAWAVHLFTASGTVIAFMALLAAAAGDARHCFLWLVAGLLIDGVDGALARKADVRHVLPNFDGSVLDLVVDFLSYVFVPIFLMYRLQLFPTPLALPLAAYAIVTSLYCFCNVQMKSSDYYFVGFPAIWNLVAAYLWLLGWDPRVNAAIVVILGATTFTTIKFLHPFRVRARRAINLAVIAIGMACGLVQVFSYPERPLVPFVIWMLASAYCVAVCAWRTIHGPEGVQAGPDVAFWRGRGPLTFAQPPRTPSL